MTSPWPCFRAASCSAGIVCLRGVWGAGGGGVGGFFFPLNSYHSSTGSGMRLRYPVVFKTSVKKLGIKRHTFDEQGYCARKGEPSAWRTRLTIKFKMQACATHVNGPALVQASWSGWYEVGGEREGPAPDELAIKRECVLLATPPPLAGPLLLPGPAALATVPPAVPPSVLVGQYGEEEDGEAVGAVPDVMNVVLADPFAVTVGET